MRKIGYKILKALPRGGGKKEKSLGKKKVVRKRGNEVEKKKRNEGGCLTGTRAAAQVNSIEE